jgi:sRNA-binding carbon storage regulator CsrA
MGFSLRTLETGGRSMKEGLLLGRRVGESCVCFVGDQEIEVVVEEIVGKRVRLRFIADQSIEILRSELLEQ